METECESSHSSPRYLVIRVGGRRWGLPLEHVRRVVPSVMVYPIPGSHPRCLGLAQVDGRPTPVIDPSNLAEDQPPTRRGPGRTLVVRIVGGISGDLALAVDEVVAVVKGPGTLSSTAERGAESRHLEVDGRQVEILDLGPLGESVSGADDDF